MNTHVEWDNDTGLVCGTQEGGFHTLDWSAGPSPMTAVLHALAGCTLVDLLGGLSRFKVNSAKVDIESERAPEPPRVFTKIVMHFTIAGEKIPELLVNKLLQKSHETYCSVGAMIGKTSEITWDIELVDTSE